MPRPLYEEGPAVKLVVCLEGHLRAVVGFEFGSALYGTSVGDEFDGSRSGSAIQFGAVMRPEDAWRLPE
jgi:hypothetical protein